ncbi:MAG: putative lipid II flippase FtsW [Clostridiales Family XIII bacterium]|jgi:cell division protein FtsW|nr:putative lipid II flippase FtsW [Clostridiales Family XIII bacterium]
MRRQNDVPDNAPKKPAKRGAAHGDFILVVLVLSLVIFGVIMVFSASYYTTIVSDKNQYYYLIRASMWAGGGLVLFTGLAFINYKVFYRFAPLLLCAGLLLLVLLFTPLGVTRGNATRWIKIGPVTIMPGEIIKICLIFFIAWYYTRFKKYVRSFARGYFFPFVLMLVCAFLIYKQPNLSTAIIVCGIIVSMAYYAGVNGVYVTGTIGAGIAGFFALIFIIAPDGEHAKRFTGFLDPFSDAQGEFYQLVQSLLALGAGGVTGVGPGKSVQKALYLPEAHNDFIFAIIGEELGFVGCIALLLVYLFLIWRCMLIAINAPDRFGKLVAAGITTMLALQVIMNVAVVTGVMPPTGVTLPFISFGGNAMLLFLGSMGIMLNISRRTAAAGIRRPGRKRPAPQDENGQAVV